MACARVSIFVHVLHVFPSLFPVPHKTKNTGSTFITFHFKYRPQREH